MSSVLEASYTCCRKVARRRARNFYYAFVLLEKPRRDAICALYAFNRRCDDLSDEPDRFGHASAQSALDDWRTQLEAALRGDWGDHPSWPAFHDTVKRYQIPHRHFHDMIDGVTADLQPRQIETFEELYRYCYLVASTVGLSVVYVLGFESAETVPLAEKCGIAFQLTNILRDVREDARMGRVYLPAEDLERFGVDPEQLRDGAASGQFFKLMRFEAARARSYYRESARLVNLVHPRSRNSLRVLIRIYSRLLERIEESDFDVLRRRIRLPWWEKCAIAAHEMLRRA